MAGELKFEKQHNPFGAEQYVLKGDGFRLSFVQATGVFFGFFRGDNDGGPETALHADGEWYILNGDWRAEYEKAAHEGLAACLAVYHKHKNLHRSSWSTDREEEHAA